MSMKPSKPAAMQPPEANYFEAIFEQASVGIAQTDLEGRFEIVNGYYCELVGRTAEELYEMRMQDITYEDDLETNLLSFQRTVQDGSSFVIEKRYVRPNGDLLWVRNNVTAIKDSKGRPTSVLALAIDITERKIAEDELRRRERRSRLLSQLSDDTRSLSEPNAIALTAMRLLRRELGGDRCAWAEVHSDQNYFTFVGVDAAEGTPSISGTYPISAFGEAALEQMRTGSTYICNDALKELPEQASRQVYHETGIRSLVATPLFKDGKLTAGIGVHMASPRFWSSEEIQLIIDVSERCWESIERARVAEALIQSEQRLRRAAEVTGFGTYDFDVSNNEVVWSEQLRSILSLTPSQPSSPNTIEEMVHPEDRKSFARAVENTINAEWGTGRHAIEFRIILNDGKVRWIRDVGQAIYEGGIKSRGVVRVIGTIQDITERKLAELARWESEERFRRLVEGAPYGMYIVDSNYRIVQMNARSQTSAFRNVDSVIGRELSDVLKILWPDEVAQKVLGEFHCTMETGLPFRSNQFVYPRADVKAVEGYEWELQRVTLSDGQFGVICYYFDSSELHRAQHALREADRRKDEFVATLAHELRNPLAPIRSGLELLQLRNEGTSETREIRDMMQRQTDQLVRLIDDLLDLSRITRGTIELRRSEVMLHYVIRNAVEACQAAIKEAEHELVINVPEPYIVILADSQRLTQVVCNLLNNATKYTPPGGKIILNVDRQGGQLIISVEDTGIGVPIEMQKCIFEMFTQVKSPALASGLGIGLTLVKSIVELHGGVVNLKSPGVGKGTTVEASLPIVLETEPTFSVPETANPVDISSLKVLVVDDTRAGVYLLRKVLESAGCEIQEAYNGQSAIEMASAFKPDAIVMDIGMPIMDGNEAARIIRSKSWGQQIRMIALTGWGQENDKQKTRAAGFDHHLVKPPNLQLLQSLLSLGRRT